MNVQRIAVVALAASVLCSGCLADWLPLRSSVVKVAGSTKRICQVTGEFDQSVTPPTPTKNRTERLAKLRGSDLGQSFSGPFGTVFFLFGDSVAIQETTERPRGGDAIAFAVSGQDPENCIQLQFYRASDGGYRSPAVDGGHLGIFETPTGGFFYQGDAYVFFATDAKGEPLEPHRSILGKNPLAIDNSLKFERVFDVSTGTFISISPTLVGTDWRPSAEPTMALLFATGPYRRSTDVVLAYLPLAEREQASSLRYFAGRDAAGQPDWQASQLRAASVFTRPEVPCMGELSVAWNRFLRKWLMLYNSCDPKENGAGLRGINFRTADEPWGPWSGPQVLFNPDADAGYCHFMHAERPCPPGTTNPKDNLIPEGRPENAFGGEYGPYVIDAYTSGDEARRVTTIYFLMSTWNPYQVVLMKSTLERTARTRRE